METELNDTQRQAQRDYRRFAEAEIVPFADAWDEEQNLPRELVEKMAALGFLGANVPQEHGGHELDPITLGLLYEEVGHASASCLSLLTVHGMVCHAINRWGSAEHKTRWLPRLASGETFAAFGLTEPDVGSDAVNVETTAVAKDGGSFVLNGHKQWISCGQFADLFLIIGRCNDEPAAFLVERGTAGFSTEPITGMLGFRSAMLAKVHMEDCHIPATNLIGRIGFGFSHVAGAALDHGRYCVAWGCLGLAEACVEASLAYANTRHQFGVPLKDHQLIQHMLADMITETKATRLMCYHSGVLKAKGGPTQILETSTAKYFASRAVGRIADDTLQIHGGNGCSDAYPVQRYLRDAKIMGIIEGSHQMQQMIISRSGTMEFVREQRRRKKQKGEA